MPTPGEYKTVQSRILAYAEAIGWTFVPREEVERRRGFDPEDPSADRANNRLLFFGDLFDTKLRKFNPRYAEAEGALLGPFRHLHTDIYGNREFAEHLRNRGMFSNSGIDRRPPQPKDTHEAFSKTSHEQHLDRS
jgi:type I restriction enzyme, R subunit